MTRPISLTTEHAEQSMLFQWAALATGRYPELADLFAIPNFSGRLGNAPPVAAKIQGAKLKKEGRKKGVPDICLPVARYRYHGLYIELKRPGGKPTDEQRDWLARLRKRGYAAVLCVGWEAARETIEHYLSLPVPPLFAIEAPAGLERYA